ncbi:MAG: hypothetical protein H9806_07850 [Candidatus Lactobacillus pullistercoris]|uniref:Ada DNA repair metal-binding domain-containing protein n=1 Tax=Candidatus Lactobacillus pullistercoris TaxID=2838636 RepID=A0A9E2KSR5_9LACO|nr:hypothetical protein [Candidatus Lactobacillus pullistercoris]
MKRSRKFIAIICAMLMLIGDFAISPVSFDNSNNIVTAARRTIRHRHVRRRVSHSRRRHHANDRYKIWTDNYKVIGNRSSKIFHIMRRHSYRMNQGNDAYFRSVAAARAAGYRQSKI